METWEVIAIDKKAILRFKNDGKEIQGIRMLLRGTEPAKDVNDRYVGFNWHDQFMSNERLAKLNVCPKVGDIINLFFNRYGDIEHLQIAE